MHVHRMMACDVRDVLYTFVIHTNKSFKVVGRRSQSFNDVASEPMSNNCKCFHSFLPGTRGSSGAVGAIGGSGSTGPIGATGPQGIKGTVGASGVAGPDGAKGAKGSLGAQGIKGDLGELLLPGIPLPF